MAWGAPRSILGTQEKQGATPETLSLLPSRSGTPQRPSNPKNLEYPKLLEIIVKKMGKWPNEKLFPVVDLWVCSPDICREAFASNICAAVDNPAGKSQVPDSGVEDFGLSMCFLGRRISQRAGISKSLFHQELALPQEQPRCPLNPESETLKPLPRSAVVTLRKCIRRLGLRFTFQLSAFYGTSLGSYGRELALLVSVLRAAGLS